MGVHSTAIEKTVRDRVLLGVAWLDQNHPGWWDKIDLDRLNMHDAHRCILGQLVDRGTYASGYMAATHVRPSGWARDRASNSSYPVESKAEWTRVIEGLRKGGHEPVFTPLPTEERWVVVGTNISGKEAVLCTLASESSAINEIPFWHTYANVHVQKRVTTYERVIPPMPEPTALGTVVDLSDGTTWTLAVTGSDEPWVSAGMGSRGVWALLKNYNPVIR